MARPPIRLLVLDVDGVLTDGRLHYGRHGEALKVFHVRDGQGIKSLLRAGIEVAVISGRRSSMVRARCRELGVRHVRQGVEDKLRELERLCAKLRIDPDGCAAVGDDVPDVALMQRVALSFAVADAHPAVLKVADRITRLNGGCGAVREVCDLLLGAGRRSGAA